jgi:hypothetical protein
MPYPHVMYCRLELGQERPTVLGVRYDRQNLQPLQRVGQTVVGRCGNPALTFWGWFFLGSRPPQCAGIGVLRHIPIYFEWFRGRARFMDATTWSVLIEAWGGRRPNNWWPPPELPGCTPVPLPVGNDDMLRPVSYGAFLKEVGRRYFGNQEAGEPKGKMISLAALRKLAGGKRGMKRSVRFDNEGGYREL